MAPRHRALGPGLTPNFTTVCGSQVGKHCAFRDIKDKDSVEETRRLRAKAAKHSHTIDLSLWNHVLRRGVRNFWQFRTKILPEIYGYRS